MRLPLLLFSGLLSCSSPSLFADENPFVGRWALTLPGGVGWLGVQEKNGKLSADLLWGTGSVVPVEVVSQDGETLVFRRPAEKKGGSVSNVTATVDGNGIKLIADGLKKPASGWRCGEIPPAPDLSKVVFGPPIKLISDSLDGWKLVGETGINGWTVQHGILSNRVPREKGKRPSNLRTEAVFEDFRLTTEVRTLPKSNSGIYLRGVYEIQILESYGQPLDSHNMGALYSRIAPSVAAEKPVGEWQTMDITLVNHHVTVVLNEKKIIDNQPALGCTGGALTSDDGLPGPIMLQGDHSDIDFRNMIIYPVKKSDK